MDLSETGSWAYRKLVHGPIGNWFVDLRETGLWTYRTPVCGPNGNRFVDLTGSGSCLAPKGLVSFSEVGLRPTSLNLTKPLMAPAYRNWFVDLCVNRFVGA